jgi:serine/threonine protein kinase
MLSEGARLGRYEIRALLGAGGMGEVYLAHEVELHRPVARGHISFDVVLIKDFR